MPAQVKQEGQSMAGVRPSQPCLLGYSFLSPLSTLLGHFIAFLAASMAGWSSVG
jgi:hypothetical protein